MASALISLEDGLVDSCAENSTDVSEPVTDLVANMADDPMSILNEIEKKCMEREVENDPKLYNPIGSDITDGVAQSNGMADIPTNGQQTIVDTDHTNNTDNTMEVDGLEIDGEVSDNEDRNSDIMAIDVNTEMNELSDVDHDEGEQLIEANGDDPSVKDKVNETVDGNDGVVSQGDLVLEESSNQEESNDQLNSTGSANASVQGNVNDSVNTVEGNDSVVSQDDDIEQEESSTLEESSDQLNSTGGANGEGESFEDPPIEIQTQSIRGIKRRKKRKKWGKGWSRPPQYKVRRLSGQSLCLSLTSLPDSQPEALVGETNEEETKPLEGDGESEVKPKCSPVKSINKGKSSGRPLLIDCGNKVQTPNVRPLPPEEFERYKEAFKYGWRRELVLRGERGVSSPSRKQQGSDVYYFPPRGSKLRSMVQIQEWLSSHDTTLTTANFSFMRRPIGVEEGEVVRQASAARGRLSLDKIKKESSEVSAKNIMKKSKRARVPVKKEDYAYHDDDNPLYDKPEVVIERDTDDAYAPIIAAGLSGEFPPVRFDTSNLPKKKNSSGVPEVYVGLNGELLETIHPSNEAVIVTPTKRSKFKATARKSTMQKPIKQPRPYSGVENLCSVKCPGLEGMAPMLMCNKCMCLFHHECVNYYDSDDEFCCLRCKEAGPLPEPATDPEQVLRVSLPVQLSELDKRNAVSINSIPTVVQSSPHPVGAVIPSTALLTRHTNSPVAKLPNMIYTKPKYPEIRPLLKVKEEPFDDSYERSQQASSEALGSLKTVLNRRSSGSPGHSIQTMLAQGQGTSLLNLQARHPQQPNMTSLHGQKFLGSINAPLHLPHNSNYKLVPVGPPVSLPNIPFQPIRLPGMSVQGLLPLTPIHTNSQPPLQKNVLVTQPPLSTSSSLLVPQDSLSKSKTKTSPSKGDSKGARLVIDGTTIGAPESGQLLTLPGAVSKKLTLNKPLVLKIKNRQISVPPSGFFQAVDGLKIFLPPNTFPTAEEEEAAENAKNNKTATSPDKPQDKSAAPTVAPCPEVKSVKSGESSTDIVKSRRGKKCCFIQKLYGGYECMFQIFSFLSIKELLVASRVCRTWRFISQHPSLWSDALFSGLKVSNWPKALEFLSKHGVSSISLLGMDSYEDLERTWNGFITSVGEIPTLRKLSFGLVPPLILDAVCLKLTNLHSVCAECVSNEEEETIWTSPTRLDIGKFGSMKELRELRLKGVCGLTLPTFSLCGGLSNLGTLEHLNTLCLTSLKNVDGSKFHFISKLKNLTELSLGDCKTWTAETYAVLGEMTSLKKLRLEQGGEIQDTGVGQAISKLYDLHTLELYLFVIADTFRDHVMGLSKLRTLLIWPDNSTQAAEVNSNTFSAVKDLSSLHRLKWVILNKQSNSIILDDNENTETVIKEQEWIPFLSEDSSPESRKTEYTGLGKLTSSLSELLPKTRIDVFCLESDKDNQSQ